MNSVAGGAAWLGSSEIVNESRVHAYLQQGFGPENLMVHGDCGCPQIRALAECDESPYVSPALDPAPWYDPAIPESGDFAGFFPTEFTGMGSTFSRDVFAKLSGGAVLGRLRPGARTLTWTGYLFGRTCCSVAYGLRWLTAQLEGSCADDTCRGDELDLLVCCPPADEDCIGDCEDCLEQPMGVPSNDDAFRTLFDVGLLEGPTIVSERRTGSCSCKCSSIMEVEFSLIAGVPYLHRQPVEICDQLFEIPAECVEFIVAEDDSQCIEPECPPVVDCTLDPACPPPVLPVVLPFADPCVCDSIDPTTVCCAIDESVFGQFFEGTVQIELTAGDAPLHNISIRFHENRVERPCDEVDDPCAVCAELLVRYVPANSVMLIDGNTKRISITCAGSNVEPAEHLTVSPFAFPVLRCLSMCICVTADAVGMSPEAGVKISVTPREM